VTTTSTQGLGLAVFARMRAHPGQRAQLVEALQPLVASGGRESGTTAYLLHESAEDPDVVWFYARFTDQQALDTHQANEASLATEAAAIGQYLAEAPIVEYGTVRSDKHATPGTH
jgi:quinol monooxygenase YgiN